jgi:hypothetical protein
MHASGKCESAALFGRDSGMEFLPGGRVFDRKLPGFVLRVFAERLCLVDRLLHPKHVLRVSGNRDGRFEAAERRVVPGYNFILRLCP